MASFEAKKLDKSKINGGKKYENGQALSADTINDVIGSGLYVQGLATNAPNLSNVSNVGTPKVSIEETADGARFKFENLKGEKGQDGKDGLSLPTGGKANEFLKKKSDADYDYEWGTDERLDDFDNFTDTVGKLEYCCEDSCKEPEKLECVQNGGLNETAIDLLVQILSAGNYNEDVTKKIEALKSALKMKEGDSSLILPCNLPVGSYTLKYENAEDNPNEYLDICSFTITADGECPIYDKLIEQNCCPSNVVSIGIYNSLSERVGEVVLGGLSHDFQLGEKLYSFAALSDIHIGDKDTYITRFQSLINGFAADNDISFVAICGDMVDNANDFSQLQAYSNVVKNVNKPVLTTMGNHEMTNILSVKNPLSYDDIKDYFKQNKDSEWGINRDTLHYCYKPSGSDDVFIMFGISGLYSKYASLSQEDIEWLHNVLEENRDKRCFLFHHYFPWDGSGDAVNCYNQNGLQGYGGEAFYSLLKHYKNVIYFHGHTHAKFSVQEFNAMNTIDTIYGRYSVHIPSATNPTVPNFNTMTYIEDTTAGEGYIVDVYENGVILKGKDLVKNQYSPIGYYCLDTTIKEIKENSYYDEYGYTSKALKKGGEWFTGCTLDKSLVTRISFVDEYMDAYDENWIPTIGDIGIVAYRNDTEIYIVGNGNCIKANAICDYMFSDFTSLTKIDGLFKLDMTNVVKIDGMFKNCKKLKQLNLSSFLNVTITPQKNTPNPETYGIVNETFAGCEELTYINLSNMILNDVSTFKNVFYGCKNLKEVKLPIFNFSSDNFTLYIQSLFQNCSSLKKIDMNRFKGNLYLSSTFNGCKNLEQINFGYSELRSFASAFADCSSIKNIDISGFDVSGLDAMVGNFKNCTSLENIILPEVFDTSKIKNMVQLFYNCPNLHIDCSSWNVSNVTTHDDFNRNSPNVTPPTWVN